MQINKDIILEIYSQSQFSHYMENGKMSYEPNEYPNKKIIQILLQQPFLVLVLSIISHSTSDVLGKRVE
jgi:hypothetical protein